MSGPVAAALFLLAYILGFLSGLIFAEGIHLRRRDRMSDEWIDRDQLHRGRGGEAR